MKKKETLKQVQGDGMRNATKNVSTTSHRKMDYTRKIIRFKENYDGVYIRIHDRVIYP